MAITSSPSPASAWVEDDRPEVVVQAYHRLIDLGRATEGIDLFAADAVFQAKGAQFAGRAEILQFLTTREAQTDRHSVHAITNVAVRRRDDEAEVSAYILVYAGQPDGTFALERVLDTLHRLRRSDTGWLVHERRSRRVPATTPIG